MLFLGSISVQELNLLIVNEGNFKTVDAVDASKQPLPANNSQRLECYTVVFKHTVENLLDSAHLTQGPNVGPVVLPA